MELEHLTPEEIEQRSFEIIEEELVKCGADISSFDEKELSIVKRCIHTTADLDYIRTMRFSKGAVRKMTELISGGAVIVTDTNMALAGINRKELLQYGCKAICFMADEEVAREAARQKTTRASISVRHAMRIESPVIFAIGNAPTALITIRECLDSGEYKPAFVIGVPVGFVNVVQAKELILETDIPCIINTGRKGGSNVAAAIVNAVLYSMKKPRYDR